MSITKKVYDQLRELREHGAEVESIRLSGATMRKLAEGCLTLSVPERPVRPIQLLGIPFIQEDRLPLGEIRIVTSRGIEAIITNVAV